MALENMNGMSPFTLVAATTGIPQYRCVNTNSAGKAALCVTAVAVDGATRNGSTGSTRDNQALAIMPMGSRAKIAARGSTLAVGDLCACSTNGMVTVVSATNYAIGRVVGGSSGTTGRILSVLLGNIGTT